MASTPLSGAVPYTPGHTRGPDLDLADHGKAPGQGRPYFLRFLPDHVPVIAITSFSLTMRAIFHVPWTV